MEKAFEVYHKLDFLKVIKLDGIRITVGRDHSNALILPHPKVSREHGIIIPQEDRIIYHDQSSYGSYVNRARLYKAEAEISHGDVIEIGDYRLIYNAYSEQRDVEKTDILSDSEESTDAEYTIVILHEAGTEERVTLSNSNVTIGKHPSNMIRIRRHKTPPHVVTVMQLKNGVYLNVHVSGVASLNSRRLQRGLHKIGINDLISSVGLRLHLEQCRGDNPIQSFLVGSSEAMRIIRSEVEVAALRLNNFTTIITGESGTGKEMVARSIHSLSKRHTQNFIAVNCSSIPEALAESLLFGHVAGSFTNAMNEHAGFFKLAHGGTLFLDEIGDLAPAIQVKILRAIESKEIHPVGSPLPLKVDTRILAGTNKPIHLASYRQETGFRDDLYYRLSGYHIEIPALRERKDDIPILIDHFRRELLLQEPDLSRITIDAEAIEYAMAYEWPGNVRELKHETQKAILLADQIVNRIPLSRGATSDLESSTIVKEIRALKMKKVTNNEIIKSLRVSRATYYRWKKRI